MGSHRNKTKIARSFSQSAGSYDAEACLQREMGEKLLMMLKGEHKNILDIGCGTGELARKLAQHFPLAKIQGIDLAPGMIEQAKQLGGADFSLADGEKTSFPAESFDLIISCAVLHWMDLAAFAREAARLARPGAGLLIATFGPKTMAELRQLGLRVNSFPGEEELQAAFAPAFDDINIFEEDRRLEFSSLRSFARGLRLLGGRQAINEFPGKNFSLRKKLNKPIFISYQLFYLSAVKKD